MAGDPRRRNLVVGCSMKRADIQPARGGLRSIGHLTAEAARPLNDAQVAPLPRLAGQPVQEGLRVPARRRQNGYDVTGMRTFDVIAGAALVHISQPASAAMRPAARISWVE